MATIGESVAVLHVKDAKLEDVGESFEPTHITVTYNTKYISVVETETQKTVKSWSVRRGQEITSPTVWNEKEGFVTVIDKKEVRLWTKDEVNFEKCKKKHFNYNIHQILSVKGYKPVVVCENGAINFLSKIKDSIGILEDGDFILKCQAFIIKDRLVVLCLVQKQNKSLQMISHTFSDDDTDSTWSCDTSDVDFQVDTPVCTCHMKQFGNDVRCHVLYSSGDLHSLNVSPLTNSIRSQKLCHLNCLQKSVSIVILNSTHIAIAGIKQGNHIGLGIYDTRFDVLHTFRPFTEDMAEDIKLFHCNNCLFTSYGKTLYMYPYSCQRSTVATILGKQNIQTDNLDHVAEWGTKVPKKKDCEKEENIRNILQQLSDKTQVTNYKKFTEMFNKVKPLLSDLESQSNLMLQFVQRCLTEEKFFPKTEVQFLIKTQAIPSVLMTHLFDALIKHKATGLLKNTLEYISNIPESCLCKMLDFILSLEEKDLDGQINGQSTIEGCPLPSTKMYFINQILHVSFNDVFLVECVGMLSFKNVLALLEYLYFLLNIGTEQIEEIPNNPSLEQVVDWLCCILDGHFTQLIISPDARGVLVHLHSIVESQVEFYDELLSLDALLQQLESRCAIPKNKMVGQYCIEVLHIL
ncbi:nucleolar protein 11-like [Mytilus californianus]|uniref:nucleolar protein 11-like n=1 Tax=Mytilus californianus TaxID=6549 RepID=UPI002245BC6B|nr:nucleolar protein 11-like [Mytilus californianus]